MNDGQTTAGFCGDNHTQCNQLTDDSFKDVYVHTAITAHGAFSCLITLFTIYIGSLGGKTSIASSVTPG